MQNVKKRVISFVALLCMLAALTGAAGAYEVTAGRNIVDPERCLQKTGLANADMRFTLEEIAAQLYGADAPSLKSIVISELPEPATGVLRLGSDEVVLYSSVGADDIAQLRFVPAAGFEGSAFFCMRGVDTAGNYSKTHKVLMTLTAEKTAPPKASGASYVTLKNFSVQDTLMANTHECAVADYMVVSEPQMGTLAITPDGRFVYAPEENKTGSDSFSFAVIDVYGNLSEPATVSIEVNTPQSDLYYEDMAGNFAHAAAISLADMGVLRGEQLSGRSFFHPAREVTRGEFLVMLMKCAEIEAEVPVSIINTGMADDREIPSWMKGFVSAAVQTGVVSGSSDGAGEVSFDADAPITRAQAAVMISNALALTPREDAAPAFTDMELIPAWARDAMLSVRECGIMRGYADGSAGAMDTLTRAQAAAVLMRMTSFQQEQEAQPTGGFNFFSWLFGG